MMKKSTVHAGLVVASLFPSIALAQGINAAEALYQIGDNIQSGILNFGSGQLAPIGMQLIGFFFALNLVWALVKGMFKGGVGDFIGEMVPSMIGAGVALSFISLDVGKAIDQTLGTIGSALLGDNVKSIGSIIRHAGEQTFMTLYNIWTMKTVSTGSGLLAWFADFSQFIPILLATVGATFFILVALCIYLAMLITSQVSVLIGLIFMPVMVPFLMFKPAGFLFDGWLRFTITASMVKIVGLLMYKFTDLMMTSLADLSVQASKMGTTGADAYTVNIVLFSSMLLLAGISAAMMASVPSIASGLVSGGGGGVGFSGWRGPVQSTNRVIQAGTRLLGGSSRGKAAASDGKSIENAARSAGAMVRRAGSVASQGGAMVGRGASRLGTAFGAGKSTASSRS